MAGSTIRELLISIGVDAKSDGLDQIDDGIEKVTKGAENLIEMMAAAGAAVAALTTGLLVNTASVAANADEIDKEASALGVSTEEYQKLAYALDDVGVGADSLPKLLGQVASVVTDAADASSPAAEALSAIGLSAEELAAMTPDEQLAAIMEGLSGVTDETEKLELANTLLGGKSEALLPLMDAQGESLEDLGNKAEAAGIIMSDDTVEAAAALNDQLEYLENVANGLMMTVGADLIPVVSELATQLTDWYGANKEVIDTEIQEFADLVADGFRAVATALISVNEAMGPEGWKTLAEVVAFLAGAGGLAYVAVQLFTIVSGLITMGEGIAAVVAPMLGIGAVANPIGLIAVGIAATVAVLAIWILYMQDLYVWLTGGKSLIGEFFNQIKASISGFIDDILKSEGFIGSLARAIEGLKNLAVAAFTLMVAYLSGVWTATEPIRVAIENLANTVVSKLGAAFAQLMTYVTPLVSAFSKLMDILLPIGSVFMMTFMPVIPIVLALVGAVAQLAAYLEKVAVVANGVAGLLGGDTAIAAAGAAGLGAGDAVSSIASAPSTSQGTIGGTGGSTVTTGSTTVSITGAGITAEEAQALVDNTLDQQARATASALEGAPI